MKKISLLLCLSLTMCLSGMAQKNQKGVAPFSHKKKNSERNYRNITKQSNTSFAKMQSVQTLSGYYLESFEGAFPPAGWTKQDPDGGTGWAQVANGTSPLSGWQGGTQTVPPGGGNYAAYCTWNTGGSVSNDQWLISPQFAANTGDSLSFYLWFFGANADTLEIRISTTNDSIADFTTLVDLIDTVRLTPMASWHKLSYSLSAYAGQNIYVAFRERVADNYNNGAYIALDLFSMGTPPPNDVATQSIDIPAIIAPGAVSPMATVSNAGSATQSFNVTMKITGGYISTKSVTSLAPGATQQITFDNWNAVRGSDTITVFTQLAGDANTSNDTLTKTVAVFLDAQTLSVDVPSLVIPGSQTPKATIVNNGGNATNFNVTMKITGGYTSTKTVTLLKTDSTAQITFDSWTATVGTAAITVFTQLTGDTINTNDTLSEVVSVQNPIKAYCYVADSVNTPPIGPAYLYLQKPDSIYSLTSQGSQNFIEGGSWGPGNKWYGTVSTDNTLITIDTTTGARTVIGNMGVDMNGLTFDNTTNKFFGVSWNGTSSSLYSVSSLTGAATILGNSSTDLLINLACDTLGNLYSLGITNDILYSVNKNTGVATSIGPIGFVAAYAQGMGFDHNTNTLYLAGYDNGTSAGDLSFVNTLTGASTEIGEFESGAEITGFAIPFNVRIPTKDASVSAFISPVTSCGLTNESVTVAIDNLGSTAISGFPVSYTINGGTPVTETFSGTIASGTSQNYTFTQQANLSASGTYIIKSYCSLLGDAFPGNDTLVASVQNISVSNAPYSMGFEPTEDYSAWKIIDDNNDGFTWNIVSSGGNNGPYCAEYSYNTSGTVAADDWLITKCIDMQASARYHVSYYYEVADATFPESFAVYIGTAQTVAAMTTQIISQPNLTNITYVQGGSDFTVPSSGTYYIGFLCNSAADEDNLYIDDINIALTSLIVSDSASHDSICPGSSSALTAHASGGSGAYTYTWSPATALSSTTGAVVTASPTVTTIYTVTASDGTNTASNDVTVTVKNCSGIKNYILNNSVSIYPNPTKGLLNVMSSEMMNFIKLYDEYGQLVMSMAVENKSAILYTSDLAEGVYYLRIETNKGIASKNVIVQK